MCSTESTEMGIPLLMGNAFIVAKRARTSQSIWKTPQSKENKTAHRQG